MTLSRQDVRNSVSRTRRFGKRALAYAAAAAVVSSSSVAQADFVGDYDPANWTTTNIGGSPDQSVLNDGFTAVITGTDNGAMGDGITYTIDAAGNGTVEFDWSYTNLLGDYGSFDYAGFLVNGAFSLLATNDDALNAGGTVSGTTSFAVSTGDVFGFAVASLDGQFGAGQLTVGEFSGPAVPEPTALGLLALGTIGGLAAGRRRRQ